jgi:hypothetical protein
VPRNNLQHFSELIALDLKIPYLTMGDYFYDTVFELCEEEYKSYNNGMNVDQISDFLDEGLIYRAIIKIQKDLPNHLEKVRKFHIDEELRKAGTNGS